MVDPNALGRPLGDSAFDPFWRAAADLAAPVVLHPFLLEAVLEPDGILRFRLKMSPSGSARPEEVIDALGLRDLLGQGAVLARTEVELAP